MPTENPHKLQMLNHHIHIINRIEENVSDDLFRIMDFRKRSVPLFVDFVEILLGSLHIWFDRWLVIMPIRRTD